MMIEPTPMLVENTDAEIVFTMTMASNNPKLSPSKSVSRLSDLSSGEITPVTDVSSVSSFLIDDDNSVSDEDENDRNDDIHRSVVTFGPVHVREYERIVGDHPDTKIGVPLSIGWAYYDRDTPVTIEKYEADRIRKGNLRMSSITRKNLLHNVFGIPEEELRAAEKEVQKIKKLRVQSAKQTNASAKAESVVKGIGRKLRKGSMSFLKVMSAASQSGMMLSAGSGMSSSSSLY